MAKMPEEILVLLEHINVWLSEYELIYVKEERIGSVVAGPKEFPYPVESDEFIFDTSKNSGVG